MDNDQDLGGAEGFSRMLAAAEEMAKVYLGYWCSFEF